MAHVGIVTSFFSEDGRVFDGGAELHTYHMARLAIDSGADVTIYQPARSARRYQVGGVDVQDFSANGRGTWVKGTREALDDGCQRLHYHSLDSVPRIAKRLYATATHHGIYWDIPFQTDLVQWYPYGSLARIYLPLWRKRQKSRYLRALSWCKDVIAEDTSLLRLVQSDKPHLRDRVNVIPNFIDLGSLGESKSLYGDQEIEKAKADGRILILVPRNLSLTKGLPLLSRLSELLWQRLGDRFLLIVTGKFVKQYSQWHHYERQLRRELNLLSPEVRRTLKFLNGVKREQMGYFYRISAIVVIPTFAYEATSFSAIEAMAYGKPLVATNVGGLNDVIDDGTSGVLVPPHAAHLAKAISHLLENPDLRVRLGNEAQRKATTCFSLDIWRER